MITIRLLTLKNSDRNLHRIFVSFRGVEENSCENLLCLISSARDYFKRFNKGKHDNRSRITTNIISYCFRPDRNTTTGKKTYVVDLKNATTEESRMLASMIYSCVCLDFCYDGETVRVDTINTDFSDVMTQHDEVEEMLRKLK